MKRSLLCLLSWVSIGVLAYSIGRGADYIIEAYHYMMLHYIWSIVLSGLLIFVIIFVKVGWAGKLIKKYKERNVVYLNLDDDNRL